MIMRKLGDMAEKALLNGELYFFPRGFTKAECEIFVKNCGIEGVVVDGRFEGPVDHYVTMTIEFPGV